MKIASRPYAHTTDRQLLKYRALYLQQKRAADRLLRQVGDEMTRRGQAPTAQRGGK